MAKNQLPRRIDSEWFAIITECRQSGLSDTEWCLIQLKNVLKIFGTDYMISLICE